MNESEPNVSSSTTEGLIASRREKKITLELLGDHEDFAFARDSACTAYFGHLLKDDADLARKRDAQIAKVTDKRFELYDDIGSNLNQLYCYFRFIGTWKELKPTDVIQLKRKLDVKVFTYSFLFSPSFVDRYKNFIDAVRSRH